MFRLVYNSTVLQTTRKSTSATEQTWRIPSPPIVGEKHVISCQCRYLYNCLAREKVVKADDDKDEDDDEDDGDDDDEDGDDDEDEGGGGGEERGEGARTKI